MLNIFYSKKEEELIRKPSETQSFGEEKEKRNVVVGVPIQLGLTWRLDGFGAVSDREKPFSVRSLGQHRERAENHRLPAK